MVLEKLGAHVEIEAGYVHAKARKGLTGAEIHFPKATVGGTHTFQHGTTGAGGAANTVAGSVLFGTNDTVSSTSYDTVTGTATRGTVAGTSAATVRVDFFNSSTDGIFYQGVTGATSSNIIATAKTVTLEGKASTQLTLPDGTVMTIFGVTGLTASIFKS